MSQIPPAYWWPKPDEKLDLTDSLKKWALWPASLGYGRVVAGRMHQPGSSSPIPVVCVGNFVAGGAGKTPTSMAIYDVLSELGMEPAFISRGYGGALATTSFRVDHERHKADEVGDEPLLLASRGMAFVGPERMTSLESAAELGATCAIFDDGMQNPAITKNLVFAVVDGRMGVGNGMCHPAGPLRAPIAAQMDFVDAVVVIGSGGKAQPAVRAAAKRGKPVLSAKLHMDFPDHLREKKLHAYCGIGHPAKFFDGLREAGLRVDREFGFADHHTFSDGEARDLISGAKDDDALLVTTQKDGMRLRGQTGALADLDSVTTQIPAKLVFEDPDYLRSLLRRAIAQWKRDLKLVTID